MASLPDGPIAAQSYPPPAPTVLGGSPSGAGEGRLTSLLAGSGTAA